MIGSRCISLMQRMLLLPWDTTHIIATKNSSCSNHNHNQLVSTASSTIMSFQSATTTIPSLQSTASAFTKTNNFESTITSIGSNNDMNSNISHSLPMHLYHESSPRSNDFTASVRTLKDNTYHTNNGTLSLFETQQQQQQPALLSFHQYYNAKQHELLFNDRIQQFFPWCHHKYFNFIWCGICNAGDFLASNIAFGGSSAHFVETIKASEPITTTTIANIMEIR